MIVRDIVAIEIHVNPMNGSNSASCLQGWDSDVSSGVNEPCCSLEFISRHLGNNASNVSIIISSMKVSLYGTVSFSNSNKINIVGGINGNLTNVSCDPSPYLCADNESHSSVYASNESAGFYMYNVSTITVSNLLIHACGVQTEVGNSTIYSAFQLHNCSDVTLMNVEFEHCVYNALFITNNFGNISVQHVTFLNNTMALHNDTFQLSQY